MELIITIASTNNLAELLKREHSKIGNIQLKLSNRCHTANETAVKQKKNHIQITEARRYSPAQEFINRNAIRRGKNRRLCFYEHVKLDPSFIDVCVTGMYVAGCSTMHTFRFNGTLCRFCLHEQTCNDTL